MRRCTRSRGSSWGAAISRVLRATRRGCRGITPGGMARPGPGDPRRTLPRGVRPRPRYDRVLRVLACGNRQCRPRGAPAVPGAAGRSLAGRVPPGRSRRRGSHRSHGAGPRGVGRAADRRAWSLHRLAGRRRTCRRLQPSRLRPERRRDPLSAHRELRDPQAPGRREIPSGRALRDPERPDLERSRAVGPWSPRAGPGRLGNSVAAWVGRCLGSGDA